MKTANEFHSIDLVLESFKKGEIVIVVDHEDRENEGDFIMAAEHVNPQQINFMCTFGKGLICTPITSSLAAKLELPLMSQIQQKQNLPISNTAFTISIDAKEGTTTGISSFDRSLTISKLTNDQTNAGDFLRPGHIFPLIEHPQGIKFRQGHTEASISLCRLTNLKPIAIICEILADNGAMANRQELFNLSKQFNLKICHINQIIDFVNHMDLKPSTTPVNPNHT